MVFSSTVFLFLFLPGVLLGHFLLPRRLRNAWLLLASLAFYAWGEQFYTAVMLISMLGKYVLGICAERARERGGGRFVVALAVVLNLGLLVAFKYANFLAANLGRLLVALGGPPFELAPVHLPIGISFFTFQAISYVVDVHRGVVRAQRNPLHLGLYITFFPQLIAGPIVRYVDVARQLVERTVTAADFGAGARRFLTGLGKKMLIANVVALPADRIFALPADALSPGLAWLGVACYTLQIYYDFSGYSDMAIGMARMFGFRFLENFNYPYVSQSITEFWRRWHISLSTWFRDYLYIPLGGNRGSAAGTYRNLMLVFLLCGFWHGASWAFVVWGLYHGLFLVAERAARGWVHGTPPAAVRHAYALLAVMVGWVFFRAETVPQAWAFLQAMAGAAPAGAAAGGVRAFLNGELALALAAGAIGALPWFPALRARFLPVLARAEDTARGAAAWGCVRLAQTAVGAAVFALSAMKLAAGTHNPFIYFRF